MKKTTKFLLGAMAMGLIACSSEEPAPGVDHGSSKGDLYATLTLDFGGTRSSTTEDGASTDGVEVGSDSENNVGQVLVVITSKDNDEYLTAAVADASWINNNGSTENPSGNNITYKLMFETQSLVPSAGKDVNVYAFCNPTATVKSMFIGADNTPLETVEANFLDKVLSLDENDIWKSNQFLMTNAFIPSKELPSQEDMYNTYNKADKAFDLGTVVVQRVAARFDFANTANNNIFPIKHNVTGEEVATVTFDGMALFNQAKNFYAFKHTSGDGTATDWDLCGRELSTNYVVSPYFSDMQAWKTKGLDWVTNGYTTPLLNQINSNMQAADYYSFTPLPLPLAEGTTDYKFWTYTSPNTIPADPVNTDKAALQTKAFTSGIVFRARINAKDPNSKLAQAMSAGEPVYVFDGVLYSLNDLQELALNNPNSLLNTAFNEAFEIENDKAKVRENVKESDYGFAVYRPTKVNDSNIYYCYYYYYNRHNDNSVNSKMGPMEFAVVRNNVYKLKLSNVYSYGHPGDPGDDPDPEDPEDPDETPETYFKVSVEVLPWVVRVNNIEF